MCVLVCKVCSRVGMRVCVACCECVMCDCVWFVLGFVSRMLCCVVFGVCVVMMCCLYGVCLCLCVCLCVMGHVSMCIVVACIGVVVLVVLHVGMLCCGVNVLRCCDMIG